MSTDLQYRLQHFEVTPPGDTWKEVSERLDKEFVVEEISIATKFSEHHAPVPAQAWKNIAAALEPVNIGAPDTEDHSSVPVIDFNGSGRSRSFAKMAQRIAAVAIVCLAIAAVYYYMNNERSVQTFTSTGVPAQSKAGMLPSLRPATTIKRAPVNKSPSTLLASVGGNKMLFRKRANAVPSPQSPGNVAANDNPDINYANINAADKLVSAEEIAISTQPILDNDGNIILDEKLISSPDINYVTVTGPNGEQTKISKKFLHALSYMNAAATDDDFVGITIQESSLWKWLFQEWRRKLLAQPTFIPSATNFLDIIELKEILHENF